MINPQSNNQKNWLAIARQVFEIEIEGIKAVRDSLDADFTSAVHLLGTCQGRVVVTGLGKSGLVGRKIAATLSSTGTPAFFLHPVEGAHGDMGMLRQEDIVLALSNSGETEELNAIMPSLHSMVGHIIALTGDKNSTLAGYCDVVLKTRVPREACPLGLAPTASTTATLALGDALAICLIEYKAFEVCDFRRFHPAGALGKRLALPVKNYMHREKIPCLSEQASLKQALQVLDSGGLGTVILLDKAQCLSGILTDGDVRRIVCSGRLNLQIPVKNFMTTSPLFVQPENSSANVLDLMEKKLITVLPVINESRRVAGIIHLHDLLGKGGVSFEQRSE